MGTSYIRSILLVAAFTFLGGCKQSGVTNRNENTGDAEKTISFSPEQRAPESDPGLPAPQLLAPRVYVAIVFAETPDLANVVGFPGAAAPGVTSVCALPPVGTPTCNPTNADGSFRFLLNGVFVGDTVTLWGNEEGFAPGRPIKETVLYFYSSTPTFVTAMLVTADKVYSGFQSDLYRATIDPSGTTLTSPVVFNSREGIDPGVSGIYSLAEGIHGEVWIGTGHGLTRLTYGPSGKAQFKNFTTSEYPALTSNYISKVSVVPNGDVWIAAGWSVERLTFEGDNITQSHVFAEADGLLHHTEVSALTVAPDGSAWIGQANHLFRLRVSLPDTKQVTDFGSASGMMFIYDVAQGLKGAGENPDLWLATYTGLHHFQILNGIPSFSASYLPIGVYAGRVACSPDGSIWAAGSELYHLDLGSSDDFVGLSVSGADDNGQSLTSYSAEEIGLQTDQFFALQVGPDGKLWLGTGAGIASGQVDALGQAQFHTFESDSELRSNDILRLTALSDDDAWVGIGHGLEHLTFDENNVPHWKFYSTETSSLLEYGATTFKTIGNDLWIGMQTGLLRLTDVQGNSHFDDIYNHPGDSLLTKWVTDIKVAGNGDVFVSLLVGGLMRYRYVDGVPTLLTHYGWNCTSGGFLFDDIMCYIDKVNLYSVPTAMIAMETVDPGSPLLTTGQSGLWVGGEALLLVEFGEDGSAEVTRTYSPQELGGFTYIHDLVKTNDGKLWMRTDQGVMLLSFSEDGTPQVDYSFEFSAEGFFGFLKVTPDPRDHSFWVPGPAGLAHIIPDGQGSYSPMLYSDCEAGASNCVDWIVAGLPDLFITDVAIRPHGGMYLGSNDRGMAVWTP